MEIENATPYNNSGGKDIDTCDICNNGYHLDFKNGKWNRRR